MPHRETARATVVRIDDTLAPRVLVVRVPCRSRCHRRSAAAQRDKPRRRRAPCCFLERHRSSTPQCRRAWL